MFNIGGAHETVLGWRAWAYYQTLGLQHGIYW